MRVLHWFAALSCVCVAVLAVLATAYLAGRARGRREGFHATDDGGPVVQFVGPSALMRDDGFNAYFATLTRADRCARAGRDVSAGVLRGAYLGGITQTPASRIRDAFNDDVRAAEAVIAAGASSNHSSTRSVARALGERALGPWKIALLDATTESGFPHTHSDVVCIPGGAHERSRWWSRSHRERVETLIHERVHVLQRKRPDVVKRVVESAWRYEPLPGGGLPDDVAVRRRSNPDLMGAPLYARGSDGLVPLQVYNEDGGPCPASLAGSSVRLFDPRSGTTVDAVDEPYEHPWERMAYEVARALVVGEGRPAVSERA